MLTLSLSRRDIAFSVLLALLPSCLPSISSPDAADDEALRRRRCGDGMCNYNETCSSCPRDCGACASSAPDLADPPPPPDMTMVAPADMAQVISTNGKYVNNSGNPACSDSSSFGSASHPWCTITYGVSQLQAGGTLYVRQGTYTDYLNIGGPAGTAAQPTVISAYPGDTVVLNGSGVDSGRVKILQTSYIDFEGFTITNYNQGLYVESADHITVRNVTIYHVGQEGLRVHDNASYVTIDSCTIHDTGTWMYNGEGLYIGTGDSSSTGNDNTNHVTIQNSTIYNTTDEGIELKPGTHDCVVDGNVIYNANNSGNSYGAGGGAIEVDEEGTYNKWSSNPNHVIRANTVYNTVIGIRAGIGGQYYNNVVWGASETGILINNNDGDSYTRYVYHNTIDMPAGTALTNSGGTAVIKNNIGPTTTNNLATSAAFYVNQAAHDYHLGKGAAPINAGVATSVTTDKDGHTRDSIPDIGAYEFGGATTCTPNNAAACTSLTCGNATNNCGQTISCGTCASGQTCQSGSCVTTVTSSGHTISAADCSQNAVATAVNAAANGDTVLVPASTNPCTWTTPALHTPALSITKAITLRGAGIGQTVIYDNTGTGSGEDVIDVGSNARVTGFTFADSRTTADYKAGLAASGSNWRIDNCRFESAAGIEARGTGVIDHSLFVKSEINTWGSQDGDTYPGDASWNSPLTLGTGNAIYIETNTFEFGTSPGDGAFDSYAGTRLVFRHNTVNGTYVGSHGLDSGGLRSTFSVEIYENHFNVTTDWYTVYNSRGGTTVMFNNTATGPYHNFGLLQSFRSCTSSCFQNGGSQCATWGNICDGTNPIDGNRPGMNGYPCLEQIGRTTGQTLAPVFNWGNQLNGAVAKTGGDGSCANSILDVVENRDFFNLTVNDTVTQDSSTGTYSATYTGDNGAQKQWTYEPYTYPHPLVTAQGN